MNSLPSVNSLLPESYCTIQGRPLLYLAQLMSFSRE